VSHPENHRCPRRKLKRAWPVHQKTREKPQARGGEKGEDGTTTIQRVVAGEIREVVGLVKGGQVNKWTYKIGHSDGRLGKEGEGRRDGKGIYFRLDDRRFLFRVV